VEPTNDALARAGADQRGDTAMSKRKKEPRATAEQPTPRPSEDEIDPRKRKKPPRKQPEKLRARG
jgi:hypothetical protein